VPFAAIAAAANIAAIQWCSMLLTQTLLVILSKF